MKTGDVLLVHGTSKLSKIIQKFQMRKDAAAGYWNHSGIIWVDKSGTYVVEMAEVKGYKFRGSTVFTPINEYFESDREILLLEYKGEIDEVAFRKIVYDYIGIPYDYVNLIWHQPLRILKGIWRGRSVDKAWKKMVCHEFVQKVWHEYKGIFPNWNKAMISEEFHSDKFKHVEL